MKLCIDCKHCRVTTNSFGNVWKYCHRNVTTTVNPVTGYVTEGEAESCCVERHFHTLNGTTRCGVEGYYFEKRKPWWRFWK